MVKDLLGAGYGFSVGSSVIEKLPASATKTHVQSGLQTGSGFFPVLGTLKGTKLVMGQIGKIK